MFRLSLLVTVLVAVQSFGQAITDPYYREAAQAYLYLPQRMGRYADAWNAAQYRNSVNRIGTGQIQADATYNAMLKGTDACFWTTYEEIGDTIAGIQGAGRVFQNANNFAVVYTSLCRSLYDQGDYHGACEAAWDAMPYMLICEQSATYIASAQTTLETAMDTMWSILIEGVAP